MVMPAFPGGHTAQVLRYGLPIGFAALAVTLAGCGDAGMAIYGATAATIYAVEGCERMCGENHLRCNPETGLCERLPCDDGCPPGATCDELRDECVPAGL